MGIIRLTLRGLGLWVDRGAYWEVLFPAAEQLPRQGAEEPLEAHDPLLWVPEAGEPTAVKQVIDLRGKSLDLRADIDNAAGATLSNPWMIHLPIEAGSPASVADGFKMQKEIISTLLLPKGILTPVGTVPATFKGVQYILAYAVTWSALLKYPDSLSYTLTRRGSTTVTTGAFPVNKGRIDLNLSNLSILDSYDPDTINTPRPNDEDFAAHYLLSRVAPAGNPQDVPSVITRKTSQMSRSRSLNLIQSLQSAFYDPEHLCSPVWGG